MGAGIATTTGARRSTRTAALLCLWAGILGAASGVFLAVVAPVVESTRYSYPLDATGFRLIQAWFVVQHVGLAIGLVGLERSGALGDGRVGRIGYWVALAGMAILTVTEAVAIGAAGMSTKTAFTGALGAGYGLSTTLLGIGLVMAGVAVARAGRWQGWARFLPLAMGIWVFVPMFPALVLSPNAGARLAITGWMLLFALLGWALARPSRTQGVAPAPVG